MKKRSIRNAVVSRERNSPLYHPAGDIYSHDFLETTGDRKDEPPNTASHLQAKKGPHVIQLEEMEKLLFNGVNPTLPELVFIGSLTACEDIGEWICLCKFLPFFA